MNLDRRHLIGGAAFAAGTCFSSPTHSQLSSRMDLETSGHSSNSARQGSKMMADVIVIGAGMAGLSAAHDLNRAGKKVIVVEARHRIGGRLYTDRSAAVPIELGPEYIHGEHASTWELVRAQGLTTYRQDKVISHVGNTDQWRATSKLSLPSDEQNFRVLEGYDWVLEPVSKGLEIELRTIVSRVEYGPSGVNVSAQQDGRTVLFQAKYVVLAVPSTVLAAGAIEFSPPLPRKKTDAFKEITAYPIAKILMVFDDKIIPQDADEIVDNEVAWYIWNASKNIPGFSGQVLAAGAEETEAEYLLALGKQDRHAEILRTLGRILGDTKLKPRTVREHEWHNDPFARGAFSENGYDYADLIYKPDNGRVFWAGTITDQIDFSYDSGKSAARVLLDHSSR